MRKSVFELFPFVAVLAIFVSCGSQDGGGQTEGVAKAADDSELNEYEMFADLDNAELDSGISEDLAKYTPLITNVRFGPGISDDRDHNITVIDSSGVAVLRVVKRNGANSVTVLRTVDLSAMTVEIAFSKNDSLLTMYIIKGYSHFKPNAAFDFSDLTDVKISGRSAEIGSHPSVVGTGDPRADAGVDFSGTTILVPLADNSNRVVRLSQLSNGNLLFSTNYTKSITRRLNFPYCGDGTGVPRWGKDFQIHCPQ